MPRRTRTPLEILLSLVKTLTNSSHIQVYTPKHLSLTSLPNECMCKWIYSLQGIGSTVRLCSQSKTIPVWTVGMSQCKRNIAEFSHAFRLANESSGKQP